MKNKGRYLLIFLCIILTVQLVYAKGIENQNDIVIEDILHKVQYISNYYEYGEGLSIGEPLQNVYSQKVGNCAHTAYTLARYLEYKGIQTRLVGIFSKRGSNHLVVEGKINDKWNVFDASNGIMYPYSVVEIVNNIDLLDEMVGEPNESARVYTTKVFWGNVEKIQFSQVYSYMKYVKPAIVSCSEDFIYEDNKAEQLLNYTNNAAYAATQTSNDTYIMFDFSKNEYINGIKIDWYSYEDYAKSIKIEFSQDGEKWEKVSFLDTIEKYKDYSILHINKRARFIKMGFSDFSGQKRFLARNIYFYSDYFDWSQIKAE